MGTKLDETLPYVCDRRYIFWNYKSNLDLPAAQNRFKADV